MFSPSTERMRRVSVIRLLFSTLSALRGRTGKGARNMRLTADEISLWSRDFRALLSSKYGRTVLRAFLKQEFAEENIDFWLAVEEFRLLPLNQLTGNAKNIYSQFFMPGAPHEVNVDSQTRCRVTEQLTSPTAEMFDAAQRRVQMILEHDVHQRFVGSDLYTSLLNRYQPQACR